MGGWSSGRKGLQHRQLGWEEGAVVSSQAVSVLRESSGIDMRRRRGGVSECGVGAGLGLVGAGDGRASHSCVCVLGGEGNEESVGHGGSPRAR